MAANGRLPRSQLAAIPGGYLRRDAARAWNAMCWEARRRGMRVPRPGGADSSYRTLPRQRYWKAWWTRRGRPGNAASPGTSNHGWGLAVDEPSAAGQRTIDAIGAPYGWQKRWSDAAHEPWHFKWRPGRYLKARAAARSPLTAKERAWADEYRSLRVAGRSRARRAQLRRALVRARKRAWRRLRKHPTQARQRHYAALAALTR